MNPLSIPTNMPAVVFFLLAWTMLWKGIALWKSARHGQKYWFIALLIVNTFGLLEIGYLFYFAKERMKLDELIFWKDKATNHKKE